MSENEKNITEGGKLGDEQVENVAGGGILGPQKKKNTCAECGEEFESPFMSVNPVCPHCGFKPLGYEDLIELRKKPG